MPNLVYYKGRDGVVSGPIAEDEAFELYKNNFFGADHVFAVVDPANRGSEKPGNFVSIDLLRIRSGTQTGEKMTEKEKTELARKYKKLSDKRRVQHEKYLEKENLQVGNAVVKKQVDPTPAQLQPERKKVLCQIELYKHIDPTHFKLNTTTFENDHTSSTQYDKFDELVQEFCRLALITNTNTISISLDNLSSEEINRIFNALAAWEVEILSLDGKPPDSGLVNLSSLLTYAQKIECFHLYAPIMVNIQEIRLIRKKIIDGEWPNLNEIVVQIDAKVSLSLMKELFGVTIEEKKTGKANTAIYRTTNESVEIYRDPSDDCFDSLYHFEGDLQTWIKAESIVLAKCKPGEKFYGTYEEIKMNHRYTKVVHQLF